MIASLQSLFGIAGLLGIAWLAGENRREVRPAGIAAGVAFQFLLALLLLKTPFIKDAFGYLNALVLALQDATEAGTSFVFGFLGGGSPPWVVEQPANSYILAFRALPLVWLIGIPWAEARAAGALMGVKTVLNELLAFLQMAGLPEGTLSERSRLIMTYALCGFANFGSLGIMIGGLGLMVPERRSEVIALGMKSLLAGTLATLMTGAMAGLLL